MVLGSSSGGAAGPSGRALVLAGGGSAGNAWQLGVVGGLAGGGVDVTCADLVVGTSAGSTTAAQVLAAAVADLYEAVVSAPVPTRAGSPGRRPSSEHLERTGRVIAAASDAADMRRRMGEAAMSSEVAGDGSWTERWRGIVGARLPDPSWPAQRLLVTAVDARTGEPVVFDRDSGVPLVDAVAASCSSGAAYAVGDAFYIDGGYRRNENADLAAGCARVLVLSPFGGRTRHPRAWGLQLDAQVDELRAGGSQVEMVFPDDASRRAFGDDVMDPTTRAPAARAGHAQGQGLVERMRSFWGGHGTEASGDEGADLSHMK